MSDEKVGYGKPPKKNQFKSKQSGNPRGRPKKTKTVEIILEKELMEEVSYTENNSNKKLDKLSLLIKRTITNALNGNIASAKLAFLLIERYLPNSLNRSLSIDNELSPDDEAILSYFLKNNKGSDDE